MTRHEFEMSEEQLKKLLDACNPVPYIAIQCGRPRSPEENANDAWQSLGEEMGFQHMTVEPSRKGQRFFTAEPVVPPVGHQGDPCRHCGVSHDDVEPGPCPRVTDAAPAEGVSVRKPRRS